MSPCTLIAFVRVVSPRVSAAFIALSPLWALAADPVTIGSRREFVWTASHLDNFTPFKDTNPNGPPDERYKAVTLPHDSEGGLFALKSADGAPSEFIFEGRVADEGVPCFLFSKTTSLDAKGWSPQDLVKPALASQFGPEEFKLIAGGQMIVARFRVRCDSLPPLHKESKSSGALGWKDRRFPVS